MSDLYTQIEQARAAIAGRIGIVPRTALVLGSGLGALADEIEQATIIPYGEIPGFPKSTVHGHRGELAVGLLAGHPVAVMRGRFHFYEGYTMQEVTFPIRVLRALGCDTLIATNAAGGLRPEWQVGNLMRLRDHIFFPGLAGHHPLVGPNDDRLGVRFPPVVGAYDEGLAQMAREAAAEAGTTLREGVYAMVSGPAFESGAELKMFQILGADAVGMSTAPEVLVARHGGMRVLAISLITNLALPDGAPANHEEVLEAGEAAKPAFSAVIRGVLSRIQAAG
ncbi:purine-nucleoside phosphorylase [Chloroflexia bacterium SDU3-3]|nr:purine-nucleoside phosphorylase [Chloroflexia bacterium SDU3-3]